MGDLGQVQAMYANAVVNLRQFRTTLGDLIQLCVN